MALSLRGGGGGKALVVTKKRTFFAASLTSLIFSPNFSKKLISSKQLKSLNKWASTQELACLTYLHISVLLNRRALSRAALSGYGLKLSGFGSESREKTESRFDTQEKLYPKE